MTINDLERFDFRGCKYPGEDGCTMVESKTGEFVRYEDVMKLLGCMFSEKIEQALRLHGCL